MKRIVLLIMALVLALAVFTSCSAIEDIFDALGNGDSSGETPDDGGETPDVGGDEAPDVGGDEAPDVGGDETPDVGGDETPDIGGDEAPDVGGDEAPDVGGDETPDVGGDETPDVGGDESSHRYTSFSNSDKALFNQYIGMVIPFIACDEYYIEGYYDENDYDEGLNYYALGNTKAEFDAYHNIYKSGWFFYETYTDDYGDTWWCYIKDDVILDISYYSWEGDNYVDVYLYVDAEFAEEATGGSSSGGSGSQGGNESGGSTTDANLLTNENAGLPTGTNGVYNVDFTDAEYVKNVTEQGYYLDGCPTTGSPGVLVIPVEFKDAKASSKGYSIDTIVKGFKKDGDADYYSVYDYYYISSYGKLSLDITVLDSWFTPKYNSSYYESATIDYFGEETLAGDQLIIDEALAYLEDKMDLSKFDSDNNGTIDSVVIVHTLDIDDSKDFYWAYRYWNIYTDSSDNYYEYDGVSANDYLWMSCGFFHESYDESGNASYSDKSVLNTYTAIHEFGHVLGADDYYDTAYVGDPMGGCDIMDLMTGDHNAYTKFNYGWLTTSRLVVTDTSVTLTLEDFTKNGDTIILANNWDDSLGAYQEYYIVVYYTQNGLNAGEYGYFARPGVIVYHVNSCLFIDDSYDETYYDIYNNNTDSSDEYGTEDNLLEFVLSSKETYTYVEGDTIPTVTDDFGNELQYTFTVDALTDNTATITFTKR